MSLFPTIHYRVEHDFPHKEITTKVAEARNPYRCDRRGTPPREHVQTIIPGELYLSLSIHPERAGRAWTRVRLCAGCAIDLRLASPFKVKGVTGKPSKEINKLPKWIRSRGERKEKAAAARRRASELADSAAERVRIGAARRERDAERRAIAGAGRLRAWRGA